MPLQVFNLWTTRYESKVTSTLKSLFQVRNRLFGSTLSMSTRSTADLVSLCSRINQSLIRTKSRIRDQSANIPWLADQAPHIFLLRYPLTHHTQPKCLHPTPAVNPRSQRSSLKTKSELQSLARSMLLLAKRRRKSQARTPSSTRWRATQSAQWRMPLMTRSARRVVGTFRHLADRGRQ